MAGSVRGIFSLGAISMTKPREPEISGSYRGFSMGPLPTVGSVSLYRKEDFR